MSQNYTIYFNGEIAESFNPIEVKKRAQSVFRLPEDKLDLLFSGESHILKENLSQQLCEQYLDQLRHIGLVAHSQPPLPTHNNDNNTQKNMTRQTTQNTKKRSSITPYFLGCLVILGGAIFGAWQLGYMDSLIAKFEVPHPNIRNENNANSNINVIETCNDANIIALLEKILTQGIPQLVQQTAPNTLLTLQSHSHNQELYFDIDRNKRLCGVLAQFKIEDPNISGDIENPSVVYEVIYEIQKEPDQSIKLSTFRQRIVSSTLQE